MSSANIFGILSFLAFFIVPIFHLSKLLRCKKSTGVSIPAQICVIVGYVTNVIYIQLTAGFLFWIVFSAITGIIFALTVIYYTIKYR